MPTLTKYIIIRFTKNGVPIDSLTPSIKIYDVTTDSLAESGVMTYITGTQGMYSFAFTTYDVGKSYAIDIDGGAELQPGERYPYAGNESFYEDINLAIASGGGPVINFHN